MQMVYMQEGKTALHYAKSAEIAKELILYRAAVDKTDSVCVAWLQCVCVCVCVCACFNGMGGSCV